MKKNYRLLILFLVLLTTNLYIFLDDNSSHTVDYGFPDFHIENTESINKVEIKSRGLENKLEKINGRWLVNQNHEMDEGMLKVLMSVLRDMRVKREVFDTELTAIKEKMKNASVSISISQNNKASSQFISYGEKSNNKTYFIDPKQGTAYELHIPGYNSFLHGIFEVKKEDWRNRFLFKKIIPVEELEVQHTESLKIQHKGNTINLVGISNSDTNKVSAYFNQVKNLEADYFIKKSDYPNLKLKEVALELKLSNKNQKLKLTIFNELINNKYRVGLLNETELMLLHKDRIAFLFSNKREFMK